MSAARPRKQVDTSTYTGRFAARLKELREKRKLTVEELAEKSGIPDKTLYRWEAATHMPSVDKLPELAKALKIKVRSLLPEA
jgi:transcriptional regulator with XRE-family HTH domain